MTYSLNTLNADRAQPAPGVVSRFALEIGLLLGAAGLLFWLLALLSHSLADPAWSTTGRQIETGNWGGRLGAVVADGGYFLLGFSVWWVLLAGLRTWLSTLAGWIRGQQGVAPESGMSAGDGRWSRFLHSRSAFWVGLVVLVACSSMLEWSRLYRFEPALPGHAGGVLGRTLGPLAERWLGFNGSTLLLLMVLLGCLPLVFRFSWAHWAERLGFWLDEWFENRREKREAVEDQRIGEQAAREREEVVAVERE